MTIRASPIDDVRQLLAALLAGPDRLPPTAALEITEALISLDEAGEPAVPAEPGRSSDEPIATLRSCRATLRAAVPDLPDVKTCRSVAFAVRAVDAALAVLPEPAEP